MLYYKTICICGGGNLGHALAAIISQKGCNVNVLTARPNQWHKRIEITDCNQKRTTGFLKKISDNPKEVIIEAEIILLCVPGYLIEPTLLKIKPFLQKKQVIGSVVCSSGFFWIANHILGKETPLFGFQRVPFICRVKDYGQSVNIKGYKSLLKIGGLHNKELLQIAQFFTFVLSTKTTCLSHFLESTLTNSNSLLHPARIYTMLSSFSSGQFDQEFLFYEEWDNESSEILIECDQEFQKILSQLPVNKEEIPSILFYYESCDATSLTNKIRSIKAFQGLKMHMIKKDIGYTVDYFSRYFTEDIPYGLLIIKSFGILLSISTPKIDELIYWFQRMLNKEYLKDGKLVGINIKETGIIQNFGINKIEDIFKEA